MTDRIPIYEMHIRILSVSKLHIDAAQIHTLTLQNMTQYVHTHAHTADYLNAI